MRRYPLSFVAGILASAGYLVFTVLAYVNYPSSYSPLNNWLSDLGNPEQSALGAILYNTGIIFTALILIIFFFGLSAWKIEKRSVQIIMLRLTQIFGILGSICMLMSAIYPINYFEIHAFWSTSLYILLSSAFIFSSAMLRYHHKVPLWLLILGFSTAAMVILTSIFPLVFILEWITVLLFLGYVTLVGVKTKWI